MAVSKNNKDQQPKVARRTTGLLARLRQARVDSVTTAKAKTIESVSQKEAVKPNTAPVQETKKTETNPTFKRDINNLEHQSEQNKILPFAPLNKSLDYFLSPEAGRTLINQDLKDPSSGKSLSPNQLTNLIALYSLATMKGAPLERLLLNDGWQVPERKILTTALGDFFKNSQLERGDFPAINQNLNNYKLQDYFKGTDATEALKVLTDMDRYGIRGFGNWFKKPKEYKLEENITLTGKENKALENSSPESNQQLSTESTSTPKKEPTSTPEDDEDESSFEGAGTQNSESETEKKDIEERTEDDLNYLLYQQQVIEQEKETEQTLEEEKPVNQDLDQKIEIIPTLTVPEPQKNGESQQETEAVAGNTPPPYELARIEEEKEKIKQDLLYPEENSSPTEKQNENKPSEVKVVAPLWKSENMPTIASVLPKPPIPTEPNSVEVSNQSDTELIPEFKQNFENGEISSGPEPEDQIESNYQTPISDRRDEEEEKGIFPQNFNQEINEGIGPNTNPPREDFQSTNSNQSTQGESTSEPAQNLRQDLNPKNFSTSSGSPNLQPRQQSEGEQPKKSSIKKLTDTKKNLNKAKKATSAAKNAAQKGAQVAKNAGKAAVQGIKALAQVVAQTAKAATSAIAGFFSTPAGWITIAIIILILLIVILIYLFWIDVKVSNEQGMLNEFASLNCLNNDLTLNPNQVENENDNQVTYTLSLSKNNACQKVTINSLQAKRSYKCLPDNNNCPAITDVNFLDNSELFKEQILKVASPGATFPLEINEQLTVSWQTTILPEGVAGDYRDYRMAQTIEFNTEEEKSGAIASYSGVAQKCINTNMRDLSDWGWFDSAKFVAWLMDLGNNIDKKIEKLSWPECGTNGTVASDAFFGNYSSANNPQNKAAQINEICDAFGKAYNPGDMSGRMAGSAEEFASQAIAIARAESNLDASLIENGKGIGDKFGVGLFQITQHHDQASVSMYQSSQANIQAALTKVKNYGWCQWAVYNCNASNKGCGDWNGGCASPRDARWRTPNGKTNGGNYNNNTRICISDGKGGYKYNVAGDCGGVGTINSATGVCDYAD